MLGRLFRRKPPEEPAAFPELQKHIGPSYRLLKPLDGETYLARDRHGQPYRVRILSRLDPELANRVQRGFAAFRFLEHPSLAPFREMGRDDTLMWLARPELEGPTLEEIARNGPQPAESLTRWMRGMLEALEVVHRSGAVYDNWELDKVLLGPTSSVLLDAGLCEHHLRDGIIRVGDFQPGGHTLIAPEKILGVHLGPEADLYSAGCVGYMLAAGRLPHLDTGDVVMYLYRVLHEEAPPLAKIRPDLPAGLVDLIDRLLAKEPEKRSELAHLDRLRLLESQKPLSVGSTDPAVSRLLQEASEQGVGDGAGHFTLEPGRALEKLRRFQFSDPCTYLLPLLASARGLGASRASVTTSRQGVVVRLECPPIPAAELTELFTAAASRSRRDPIAHLGLGVVGALGAGAQRVEVIAHPGRLVLTDVAPPVLQRGGRAGLEVRVKGLQPYPAALERLRGRMAWFPVPLVWNKETVSVGDTSRAGWIPLSHLPEGFSGWVSLSDAEPGLVRRVDGLSYRAERQFVLPGGLAVLDGPWSLDLSYQGVSPNASDEELRAQAHQELVRAGRDEVLQGPVQRDRAALISALLPHLDEETCDTLHERILAAADDVPQDYSFDPFGDKRPELSPWDKLVERASLAVYERRRPGLAKASRLLTHPRHADGLYSRSWEWLRHLASDAYSEDDPRYWSFLVYIWVGFDTVTPPLLEIPVLLRRLPSGRRIHYNWGHYVRNRLTQLGMKHKAQLPWLCQEWLDNLPAEGYDLARQWCRAPTRGN